MMEQDVNTGKRKLTIRHLGPIRSADICLTDMARYKDKQRTNYIIQNWMRARNTIEYLGVWEQLHNPNFNSIEFDAFRNQSGLNLFSLTPKEWADKTNAIGIYSKAGRYGGTYAHKDIAELIKQGVPRDVRYEILHRMAEEQLKVLNDQNAEYRFKKLTSSTELIK